MCDSSQTLNGLVILELTGIFSLSHLFLVFFLYGALVSVALLAFGKLFHWHPEMKYKNVLCLLQQGYAKIIALTSYDYLNAFAQLYCLTLLSFSFCFPATTHRSVPLTPALQHRQVLPSRHFLLFDSGSSETERSASGELTAAMAS